MGILHAFSNCVRETFNHGLSPSEVDWGDPKGELTEMLKYTSNGCMLMEVDCGGHGSSSNNMTEFLLSELDWGAHDPSFFLFLVNIDYDVKLMEFFTQGLW